MVKMLSHGTKYATAQSTPAAKTNLFSPADLEIDRDSDDDGDDDGRGSVDGRGRRELGRGRVGVDKAAKRPVGGAVGWMEVAEGCVGSWNKGPTHYPTISVLRDARQPAPATTKYQPAEPAHPQRPPAPSMPDRPGRKR